MCIHVYVYTYICISIYINTYIIWIAKSFYQSYQVSLVSYLDSSYFPAVSKLYLDKIYQAPGSDALDSQLVLWL